MCNNAFMRRVSSLTLDKQIDIRLRIVAAKSHRRVNQIIEEIIKDALPQLELQAEADAGA